MDSETRERTIDDYIDAAKARLGIGSDRELSRRLFGRPESNVVGKWRTRRAFPRQKNMVALAELAGLPVSEALRDLSQWRTQERTREAWLANEPRDVNREDPADGR